MTATIMWATVERGTSIGCPAPSEFIKNMELVFGGFPVTVTREAIDKLEVMAIMYDHKEIDLDSEDNPYIELINALNKHGAIEIYAMY